MRQRRQSTPESVYFDWRQREIIRHRRAMAHQPAMEHPSLVPCRVHWWLEVAASVSRLEQHLDARQMSPRQLRTRTLQSLVRQTVPPAPKPYRLEGSKRASGFAEQSTPEAERSRCQAVQATARVQIRTAGPRTLHRRLSEQIVEVVTSDGCEYIVSQGCRRHSHLPIELRRALS